MGARFSAAPGKFARLGDADCDMSWIVARHTSCSMAGMSFHAIVDGPEMSRRFGRVVRLKLSKGANAVCNRAGASCRSAAPVLPTCSEWWREDELLSAVHAALSAYRDIECITISGMREPTLHPRFAAIVDGLRRIRARRAPAMKLAVVSNGSTLDRLEVRRALSQLDKRVIRVDSGDATTFRPVRVRRLPTGRPMSG